MVNCFLCDRLLLDYFAVMEAVVEAGVELAERPESFVTQMKQATAYLQNL